MERQDPKEVAPCTTILTSITTVPMMDFMNHSGSENVSIHVLQDGEGGTVAMHSSARLEPGSEVLNNYGTAKSNEELLAMYGFAQVVQGLGSRV
jgi:hypothetical protein